MSNNYQSETRVFEAFIEALARRIGGRGATITMTKALSQAYEGRTDLLLQGGHGEIWVSMHRGGFEADPGDFLLLVRIFDSVFPAFRVSSPSAEKMPFEHQHHFEMVSADLGRVQLSGAFQGQFSNTEMHFMQWFILSEHYLTIPIVAKMEDTGSYRTFLDAQYLGGVYQLEWMAEVDGQQLYSVAKDSETQYVSTWNNLVMGQVTLSLTDFGSMLSGAPLALNIPELITGICTDGTPSPRTVRRIEGVFKESSPVVETFANI